jgi:TetR/AcrR family transcriptional regulator, transcriptional repressor for nem operon
VKVTKQQKEEHRSRIIAAAARQFREKGFEGISVSDLMKEAGLTHGAFYGHFASKEELVALASKRAMEETYKRWEKVMKDAPERPIEALSDFYLSAKHSRHPEAGCLLAALGGEVARQPESVKQVVMEEQERLIGLIAGAAPGRTEAARRKHAVCVLANLVGGMVLARHVSDPDSRREMLETVSGGLSAVRSRV